jgi:hypothetical protein
MFFQAANAEKYVVVYFGRSVMGQETQSNG